MPVQLNCIPNYIQTDWKFCKIIGEEGFAFLHSCDLESSQGLLD